MLGAFLRFAGQIEGGGNHHVWIGSPDVDFGIEPSDINLGGGKSLLPGIHALAQLYEL